MASFLTSASGLLIFALASCARMPRAPSVAAARSGPIAVGTVAVVNEEGHFVLIDLGSLLSTPEPGTNLRALSDSGGFAHLRASREQKRPFIAADIVDGHPEVGDEVVR